MDAKWWWLLGMLGPFGAMAIVRSVLEWRAERRAISEPELIFASQDQIMELESVLEELFPTVLGYSYHDCIITDESSLGDFASSEEESERMSDTLASAYGIALSELPDDRLVTVARAVASRRV
jgi:hypothetical protein